MSYCDFTVFGANGWALPASADDAPDLALTCASADVPRYSVSGATSTELGAQPANTPASTQAGANMVTSM